MGPRILVSHDEVDIEPADDLATLFRAVFADGEVVTSAVPREILTPQLAAWVRQELARADVVVALLPPAASSAHEVGFHLGAGWALGKRLALVAAADTPSAPSWRALSESAPVARTPEALLDLVASLASEFGAVAHYGPATTAAIAQFCDPAAARASWTPAAPLPKGIGAARENAPAAAPVASTETKAAAPAQTQTGPASPEPVASEPELPAPNAPEPVAPEPEKAATAPVAPEPEGAAAASPVPEPEPIAPVPTPAEAPAPATPSGLPTCIASFEAGRAFSDCVFNHESGPKVARELDVPFGGFLASLGGNWSTLRDIGDLEVWMEAADNLLEHLKPEHDHVRAWYEIGFQLQTMLNVIAQISDADADERGELLQMWKDAWVELKASAREAALDADSVNRLELMLDNLRGPEPARDYTFMARIQEMVRGHAERTDRAAGA
jgi:hypothetical protein